MSKEKGIRSQAKLFLFVLLLAGLVSSFWITATYAGSKSADNNAPGPQVNKLSSGEKLTVWSIIQMNDWLLWPFVLITASGIMLITYRTLYERNEKLQSKELLQRSIQINDLRSIEQLVRARPANRAVRMIQLMFNTFKKTRQAGPLVNDINQFLNEERQLFETFQRLLNFLSESSGALGLLGTVWGIFITFHTGNLDGPMILRGMSVALITTLTGLIISLILNLGGTGVFSMFNNQLNLLATRGEELRQVFMYIEAKKIVTESAAEKPASAQIPEPEYENSYPEPKIPYERTRPPVRNRQAEPTRNTADFLF